MDWLKDPKNQKIVVPIMIAVILGALVACYFLYLKPASSSAPADQTASQPAPGTDASNPAGAPAPQPAAGGAPQPGAAPSPTAPTPGATPAPTPATEPSPAPGGTAATPGAVGAVAQAPVAAAAQQVAKVVPMQTWRSDPFQPIGYKPPKKAVVKARIIDFPFTRLPGISISQKVMKEVPEIQQPPRRMAGILLNDRVYAIIESGGTSQVVQPGDYLLDRLASVERIEPGKVILKTVDKKPRYITVRMAASEHTDTGISGGGMGAPSAPTPAPNLGPMPPGTRIRQGGMAPP